MCRRKRLEVGGAGVTDIDGFLDGPPDSFPVRCVCGAYFHIVAGPGPYSCPTCARKFEVNP